MLKSIKLFVGVLKKNLIHNEPVTISFAATVDLIYGDR